MTRVLVALASASVAAILLACAAFAGVALELPVVVVWCASLLALVLAGRLARGDALGAWSPSWWVLAPFAALFARLSCAWELTASREWRCGTGELGWALVPVLVGLAVVVVGAPTSLLADRWRPSPRGIRRAATAVLALALALAAAGVGWIRASDPGPAAELDAPTLVARWPADGTTQHLVVGGRVVTRLCDPECRLRIDADAIDTIDASRPLEILTAAGHSFVRSDASPLPSWVLVDRSEPLTLEELGAAPRGFGALALAGAWLAVALAALAVRASARAARLADAPAAAVVAPGVLRIGDVVVACAPELAPGPALVLEAPRSIGTYRAPRAPAVGAVSGARAPLVDEVCRRAREHAYAAVTVLALGVTPAMVALALGLSLGL